MPAWPENPPRLVPPTNQATIHYGLKCRHCGEPLLGIPFNGWCPKCRKQIGSTLDLRAIDTATAAVSANVPCVKCGYNLRTLRIEGKCPECGHAIIHALHRNALSMAGAAWRQRVLQGINRLLVVATATPALFMMLAIFLIALPGVPRTPFALAETVIEAGSLLLLTIGVFGVTAKDVRCTRHTESAWPGRIARIAIIFSGIGHVGGYLTMKLGVTGGDINTLLAISTLSLFFSIVCGLISLAALGFCLRYVARRARDKPLITKTNTWLTVFIATAIVGTLLLVALVLHMFHDTGEAGLIGYAILLVLGVLALGLYVPGLLGLLRFRKLLHHMNAFTQA